MSNAVSATTTPRELLFVLAARPAENAMAEMRKFADEAVRQQERINRTMGGGSNNPGGRSGSGGGTRRNDDERRAAAERRQIERNERTEREANLRARAAAEKAALNEQRAAEKAAQRERDRMTRDGERARLKAEKQRVIEAERAEAAILAAAKKAAAEQEREEERIHRRHRMRQLERARRNRMGRDELAAAPSVQAAIQDRATKAADGKAATTAAAAQLDQKVALKETSEGLSNAADGVVKLGKGFAMLGLLGEEDTDKVIHGLIKIKAASDAIEGGIAIWRGLRDAVIAYRAALAAAAIAAKALAEIEGRRGLKGIIGNAAPKFAGMLGSKIAVEATSNAAASLAPGKLASMIQGGRAAEFASSSAHLAKGASIGAAQNAPQSMMGMLGSRTAGAAAGAVSQVGIPAGMGGMVASGAGAGAVGGAGTGVAAAGGLGIAATAGAAVAALASVVAAGKILHETLTGAGDDASSWSRKVNEYLWLPLSDFSEKMTGWSLFGSQGNREFEASKAKSEEAAANRNFKKAQGAARADSFIGRSRSTEEMNGFGVSIDGLMNGGKNADTFANTLRDQESAIADQKQRISSGGLYLGDREREQDRLAQMERDRFAQLETATNSRGPSREQIENAGRMSSVGGLIDEARGEMGKSKDAEERAKYQERINELERQRIQLGIDGARIAKDEAKVRMEAGRETIRNLEIEKRERFEIIKRIQDSVKSARERFGELDPSQQQTAIKAKQKLDQADTLERAGDIAGAERARAGLDKSERDVLRGLGLESVDEGVGKAAGDAGKRAGFDQYFGQAEQAKVAREQKAVQAIEAAVKVNQTAVVTVEMNSDEMVADMVKQTKEQIAILRAGVSEEFRRELDKALIEIDRQYSAATKAKAGAQR